MRMLFGRGCLCSRTFQSHVLQCGNLFDCQHDTLKNDYEFLPDAPKGWTRARYNDKLAKIAKVIVATGVKDVPDLVGLCEVENDHCMKDLTEYSPLREAGYRYVMTDSPDQRGIDVALLYQRGSFKLLGKTPFVFRTKRLTGRLPVTFFM